MVDLLSTLPVDTAVSAFGGDGGAFRSLKLVRALRLIKLLKLIRILKLKRLADAVGDSVSVSPALVRLAKLFFQVAFLAHLTSCFWFFLTTTEARGSGNKWYEAIGLTDASTGSIYLASLYSTFTAFSTGALRGRGGVAARLLIRSTALPVGFGDVVGVTDAERLFLVGEMLVGGLVFGYVVGGVATLVSRIDAAANRATERMEEVKAYMVRVSKHACTPVRRA